MAPADDNAPATKQDIRMLMEEFGKIWQWKTDVDETFAETGNRFNDLEEKMELWKKELKDHFDLVAENIKHDFKGAFHDKLEQHEDRIVQLEEHVGLAA